DGDVLEDLDLTLRAAAGHHASAETATEVRPVTSIARDGRVADRARPEEVQADVPVAVEQGRIHELGAGDHASDHVAGRAGPLDVHRPGGSVGEDARTGVVRDRAVAHEHGRIAPGSVGAKPGAVVAGDRHRV